MNNSNNVISVLFLFDNDAKFVAYPDEISSLVFGVETGDEENGIELDVEYVEQVDENEIEIEVLMDKVKFLGIVNIIKNPYYLVIGMLDDEIEITPINILSVKEVTELREDGENICYCINTGLAIKK